MSQINTVTANRCKHGLTLVFSRVMPVVINNFRTKLICVVLAGLALPQMVSAAPGAKSGNPRGNRSAANAAARNVERPTNSNRSASQSSLRKKYAESKSAGSQDGQTTTGSRRTFRQSVPFPNGNTGINGSGQPDKVVPFQNGNTGINGTGQPTTGGRLPPGRYFPSTGAGSQQPPPKLPASRYFPTTGGRPPMTASN